MPIHRVQVQGFAVLRLVKFYLPECVEAFYGYVKDLTTEVNNSDYVKIIEHFGIGHYV